MLRVTSDYPTRLDRKREVEETLLTMNHELHIYEPTASDPFRPNDSVIVTLSIEKSPWLPKGTYQLNEHRRNVPSSRAHEGKVIGVVPGNMRTVVLVSIMISGVEVSVPCFTDEIQKKTE